MGDQMRGHRTSIRNTRSLHHLDSKLGQRAAVTPWNVRRVGHTILRGQRELCQNETTIRCAPLRRELDGLCRKV